MNAHRSDRTIDSDVGSMADRYLWDGSGEVDPTIARLERALQPLRYQARSAAKPPASRRGTRSIASSPRGRWQAAAGLALAIAGVWAGSLLFTSTRDGGSSTNLSNVGWKVTALDGQPRVAQQTLTSSAEAVLRVGEWIETDETARATIAVGEIGTVTVESESRLRLVSAERAEHLLELARGTIDAFITAPPRLFMVDTPAGTAVDLGCAYTLSVDEAGDGTLDVTMGWVSFEWGDGRESVVPRGAMCLTRKGRGPGTPFYGDASPAMKRALHEFDFGDGRRDALATVLAESRDRDSLTLWHLLSRVEDASDRAAVFDRLASIQPPPRGISREAILRGDATALRQWRDTFIWSPSPPVSPIR